MSSVPQTRRFYASYQVTKWYTSLRGKIPKRAQRYFQGRIELKQSLLTKRKRVAQPIANHLYERNMAAICNILLELADGTKVIIDQETPEIERKTANELLSGISATTTTNLDNLPELAQQYLS